MVALISFIEGLQGFVFLSRTKRDKPIFVRRWWFLMWLHSNYLNEISRITRFREDTPKCLYQLSSTIKLLLISPQFFLSVLRYTSSSYRFATQLSHERISLYSLVPYKDIIIREDWTNVYHLVPVRVVEIFFPNIVWAAPWERHKRVRVESQMHS